MSSDDRALPAEASALPSGSRRTALVTGSADRVAALRAGFEASGVRALGLVDVGPGTGPLDVYVQLGLTVPVRGETVVRRVHAFLNDGLLERYLTADRVRPMLAPDAVVLLVAGNTPTEVTAPDDRAARVALLRVLAHALRADLAPARVRVRVVTGERTDAELVGYALGGGKDPLAEPAIAVDRADEGTTGRGYEDWRAAVLGMFQVET
jgi:hypothetical protein